MHRKTAFYHSIPSVNTSLAICLVLLCCFCHKPNPEDSLKDTFTSFTQMDFPDVLHLKGLPDSVTDRSVHIFSDKGAWFGYALPEPEQTELAGSFSGPFLLTQNNGLWLSPMLSRLELLHPETGLPIPFHQNATIISNHAYPGKLVQVFETSTPSLSIKTELIFISKSSALTRVMISNTDETLTLPVSVRWSGEAFLEEVTFSEQTSGIRINFPDSEQVGMIKVNAMDGSSFSANENAYSITAHSEQSEKEVVQFTIAHSICFSENEWQKESSIVDNALNEAGKFFFQNTLEWDDKISTLLSQIASPYDSSTYHQIAIKCLQTLNTNWRSPAGFLHHDGLFPSYHYKWFNGFWAWDSWKQAVAIAYYDTQLAQNQIRAMFDFQDRWGMIADCVYRDTLIENHNWRNTKPPLSAWATWRVYEQSQDTAFLSELLPKIEAYHQWWYQFRDIDQNGLCEYGSTDGTLIAAKWESGMDNAVRFDSSEILQAPSGGYSLNQESIDLNAYLFAEKLYLSNICRELGMTKKSKRYTLDSRILQQRIQQTFFDEEKKWFFDLNLNTRKPILTYGPEGWIPLWTLVASEDQVAGIRNHMLDSNKFVTYIPFPTLAANHPKFKPDNGYWRGPIWLDQVFFAIEGLRNYGYDEDADLFTYQLLNRLEGLKNDRGPIRENYHPLTGAGLESYHFSWSAAHILMLMLE